MVELPKELWAAILGRLEDAKDYGRAQLVSQTFHALVQDKCWTKIRKIAVLTEYDMVVVLVDTAVPQQKLQLPILQSGLILEKLVQKAIKTTEIHLWLNGPFPAQAQRHKEVICRFLLALTAIPDIKIHKFSLSYLRCFMSIFPPMAIPKALAVFLNAKNKYLTSLVIHDCRYDSAVLVPAQLLQAFQDSRALEYVSFSGPEHYIRSILLGKTQLKTLKLASTSGVTGVFAMALLESEAALLKLKCSEEIVHSYFKEVHRRNLLPAHPLRSLQKLKMGQLIHQSSFPWSLFPHLQQFFISRGMSLVSIESFVQLVCSFMLEWSGAAMETTLDWQINCLKILNEQEGHHDMTDVELLEAAIAVKMANGCHVSITHPGGIQPQHMVTFRKGNATLKVLVGYPIDLKFIF